MAVDIGPRIGIDGEAEFRKQINNITEQVKTFGSEMKVLASAVDDSADAESTFAQKNSVLTKAIEAQQQKIDLLQKGLKEAADQFGESDTKTLKWQQAVNKATAELNKMQSELGQNERAMNGLDEATDNAGKGLIGFGDILSANIISDAITGAISGIVDGFKQAVEESREFRKIMGSLEISSEKAGYSAAETEAAYNSLYGVLADNQTAATTTANLQALGLEQEQLNQLINGTIGAWATYGDSIPIDGLAEAINETAQVGTVTGTFADVLNWAGTSEDEFNEKLANCSTESERANLILQELANQGLIAAGEGWQQNNASLVAANQATADYESTMAELGEIVEPVLTAIQIGINTLLGLLVSLLQTVNFEAIVSGITEIITFFTDLVAQVQGGSLSIGEAFSLILSKLGEIVTNGLSLLSQSLPQFLAQGSDIVTQIVSGIISGLPSVVSAAGQIIRGCLNSVLSGLTQIMS